MGEMFSLPFMQRALLAGLMISFVAGYFGVFVVQRRLSFLGAGLSHAAFGGVALGLYLGCDPMLSAIPFTVAVALAISWVRDKTNLAGDTAIGIFFAVSMALGVVFLSLLDSYSTDAMSYLFGSILAVKSLDLWVSGALVLVTAGSFPLWGRWAYATFDRELALSDRLWVRLHDGLLSVLIALTVVISIKMLGIVLVAAFLVIPAASARLISGSFFAMTLWAIVLGMTSTVVGLGASYELDIPSGATIILGQALLFFALFSGVKIKQRFI